MACWSKCQTVADYNVHGMRVVNEAEDRLHSVRSSSRCLSGVYILTEFHATINQKRTIEFEFLRVRICQKKYVLGQTGHIRGQKLEHVS